MNKLRVWHMPQLGCDATLYVPVKTTEEGKKVMDLFACYDLFQLENNIKPDYSNASGIEIFNEEEQEWEDWYLETDIDYFEDNKEMQKYTKELFGQLKG